MALKTTLDHVSCARIPKLALPALAGLRRVETISVLADENHAWLFWEAGDDPVLRAILPAEGVELYERRGEAWYRPGRSLPSFAVPSSRDALPIDRAVFPAPFAVDMADDRLPPPVPLRLVRDIRPRPTSAAFCSLVELGRWAESAPSAEIEATRGALSGGSVLLLGRDLPVLNGAVRYWGRTLLVPIGLAPAPALPEAALLEALGARSDELLRATPADLGGELVVESIPLSAFGPLTRAGIRLAMGVGTR
jgi:hypothetical protein